MYSYTLTVTAVKKKKPLRDIRTLCLSAASNWLAETGATEKRASYHSSLLYNYFHLQEKNTEMWAEWITRFPRLYTVEWKAIGRELRLKKTETRLLSSISQAAPSDSTQANVEIHRSDRSLSHSIAPGRQISLSDSEGLLCMKAAADSSAPVPALW